MTAVETLRRAATEIRRRADAATPGPWKTVDNPRYVIGYARSHRRGGGFDPTPLKDVMPGYGGTSWPEDAEREALIDALRAAPNAAYLRLPGPVDITPTFEPYLRAAVESIVAAREAAAEKRGAIKALREAAAALAGRRNRVPNIALPAAAAFATCIDTLTARADQIEKEADRG